MGEMTDRVVQGVRDFLTGISVHVEDERVLRYVVDELRTGRDLDDIMGDPYVVNHTNAEERSQIMQNPEVLRGIEAEIAAEFADYRREVTE